MIYHWHKPAGSDDLFPGSGAVGAAWAEYVGEKCPLPSLPLA